jgi:hypothetical protein
MQIYSFLAAGLAGVSVAACSAIPEFPTDFQYPIQEILRYAVCELRDAYVDLNDKQHYPYFHAENYSIKVALNPKVDAEADLKAGLTGKSTSLAKRYSNSWIGGAFAGAGAPGAGLDIKGHQDGTASFIIKSASLISKDLVLECDRNWSPAKHALTQNLGIRSWLLRSSSAGQLPGIHTVADVDSHIFGAEIFVKFDAAGQFTYLFPLGTDFASVGGQYSTDEFLTITITSDPPKQPIRVQTIPGTLETGQHISRAEPASRFVSPDARTRLELLQLQQTLGNLQVRVTQ